MSKGDKIPYRDALEVAQALELSLSFVCERTLIAGSLRRRKSEVGDLELVVLPRFGAITDMFGEVVGQRSLLDDALTDIAPTRTKDGERYKQFVWEGMPVDLFIASRETWGCIATIRTGSADFTHWLVTPRNKGGGCYSHLKFHEGRLMDGATALDTSEERLVFAALEQDWIEPVDRIDGRWKR
jgi:DNA polymerase/3'-5' exonuclease PolX